VRDNNGMQEDEGKNGESPSQKRAGKGKEYHTKGKKKSDPRPPNPKNKSRLLGQGEPCWESGQRLA